MTPEEKRALLKRSLEDEQLSSSSSLTPQQKRDLLRKAMLETPIAPAKDISMTESFLSGAGQGFGYQLGDEAYAALRAGQRGALGESEDIGDTYKAERQKAREYLHEAEQQNPISFRVGEVAGGLGAAVTPGYNLGKAGSLGRFGQAAAVGGLYGYGASESDRPIVQAEHVAKGAMTGAALQKGFEMLPGREALRQKLREKAAEKAVKASGAMTKEFRNLDKKGFIQPQGEYLLEKKVVTPLASLETIGERAGALREEAGQRIGGIINQADTLKAKAMSQLDDIVRGAAAPSDKQTAQQMKAMLDQQFGFSYQKVADRIEGLISKDSDIAASKFHRGKLQQMADFFREIGTTGPLSSGLKNKTEQRRLLKDVESLGEEYKQQIYDIISDELEQGVAKIPQLTKGVSSLEALRAKAPVAQAASAQKALAGEVSGLPAAKLESGLTPYQPQSAKLDQSAQDIVNQWRQANRDYAASAVAQRTAENRLGNVRANRDYGLTTGMATAAGMITGGAPMAVALGGINNFARKYGATLQATGAWNLAKMLEAQPSAQLGKYAGPLREALQRGGDQFLLTNYLIAKSDPNYKGFLDSLMMEMEPAK